jgi:hypothetical protein
VNKIKIVHHWLKITGILFILLGITHIFVAIIAGIELVKSLPVEAQIILSMGNIVTGLAVGVSGLLILYCSSGIKHSEQWAWTISFGTGLFICIIGIGYIIITPYNPFAYLAFLTAVCEVITLCFFRKPLHLNKKIGSLI